MIPAISPFPSAPVLTGPAKSAPRVAFGAEPADAGPAKTPEEQGKTPPNPDKNQIDNLLRAGERLLRNIEFAFRKLGGMLFYAGYRKTVNEAWKTVDGLDPKSADYLKAVIKTSRMVASNKETEINRDDGIIRGLAESDEACIFVINHDYQLKDSGMLALFNALLYEAYLDADRGETAPRPKVILNEDIILSQHPTVQKILTKMGFVGVDASLYTSAEGSQRNRGAVFSLLKEFIRDESNVFIFPEGKMTSFRNLTLREKFQPGVADMIQVAARSKKRVKVVPLGFACKKGLYSIEVGEPVYFKRDGKGLKTSTGSVTPENSGEDYRRFFWPEDRKAETEDDGLIWRTLTREGEPLGGRDLNRVISGVLCRNMEIAREKARKKLPKKSLGDDVNLLPFRYSLVAGR